MSGERCDACGLVLVALPSGETGCAYCATAETRALGREARDRGVDSAGNAALAEEVTCLRAQLARATEARDTLSAALRIATAGCDKAAALLAERTAERDEVTAERDRLTAIVAEYATRETEPPRSES